MRFAAIFVFINAEAKTSKGGLKQQKPEVIEETLGNLRKELGKHGDPFQAQLDAVDRHVALTQQSQEIVELGIKVMSGINEMKERDELSHHDLFDVAGSGVELSKEVFNEIMAHMGGQGSGTEDDDASWRCVNDSEELRESEPKLPEEVFRDKAKLSSETWATVRTATENDASSGSLKKQVFKIVSGLLRFHEFCMT